ncbi:MAG: hypothetical protein MZW92_42745 [Comamonadaceae bacterium]|nr:hypothetical protein [Comamonadaceae bacterium]
MTLVSEGAAASLVGGELKGDERIAVRGVAALKAALSGIGGEMMLARLVTPRSRSAC